MSDCIFCKIVNGDLESEIVYQDETVSAFQDINPAAPVHLLIVPKKHIPSVQEMDEGDEGVLGHLFTAARQLAEEQGIKESGFRLIINNGPDAHQEIPHLHMHLLGGQAMRHPLG